MLFDLQMTVPTHLLFFIFQSRIKLSCFPFKAFIHICKNHNASQFPQLIHEPVSDYVTGAFQLNI